MQVKIRERSLIARLAAWKLGAQAMAITLGHTIYLHKVSREEFLADKNWVCHELIHVQQFRRYGYLPFLFRYLWESLLKGYYHNRWEEEARTGETDHSTLQQTRFH